METAKIICFYLGKPCRYGSDAPPEEQMDCATCPAYIMWCELVLKKSPHEMGMEDPDDKPELPEDI